jgi:hypothetical protein
MAVYEFHKQLRKGKKAELLFKKYFKLDGEELLDSGTRDYDFTTDSLRKVELKTDFYTSDNFYIEYSFGERGDKPGSLWQSHSKQVDAFIFWFPRLHRVFIFNDLTATTNYVESYIKDMNLTPIIVQNKGFYGVGYKIPRVAFQHLYEEVPIEIPSEELTDCLQC